MPRWLSDRYRDRAQQTHESGMQAGRVIANSIEQNRRLAQQQMQWEAELPIVQQRANNETVYRLAEMQAQNAAQENKNAIAAGNAAVASTTAEIARRGLWDKPEGRAMFYDTVSKHPWVMTAPGFRAIEDQFSNADRAAASAERARIEAESRKTVADTQAAARLESAAIRGEYSVLNQDLRNLGMEMVADASGKWSVRKIAEQNHGAMERETVRGMNRLQLQDAVNAGKLDVQKEINEGRMTVQELRNAGMEMRADAQGRWKLDSIAAQGNETRQTQNVKDEAAMERLKAKSDASAGDVDAAKLRLNDISRRRVALQGSLAKSPGKGVLDFGEDNRKIELRELDAEESALRKMLGTDASSPNAPVLPVVKSYNSRTNNVAPTK